MILQSCHLILDIDEYLGLFKVSEEEGEGNHIMKVPNLEQIDKIHQNLVQKIEDELLSS